MAASTSGKEKGKNRLASPRGPEKGGMLFPQESIKNGPRRVLSPLAGRFPGNGEPPRDDTLRKEPPSSYGKHGYDVKDARGHRPQHSDP